jgi:N-acetylglucosaminyldiphosphoundecaprenol N-acetyl-beta-D-mannosaminyltransferase
MRQVKILNLAIDNLSMSELLEDLQEGVVFTPNVDHLMKVQHDPEFAHLYSQVEYTLCDSKIIHLAARFLGHPIKEKISGSDLFPAFYNFHRHNSRIKIFLLGAQPGVAFRAAANINAKVGREMVVGTYSPPFGFESDANEIDYICNLIHKSGATVLAVGLTPPKQEKLIFRIKQRLPLVKLFFAIGGTIAFEAGSQKRAPEWISEAGLEWLFRLLSEPKRLWRRYILENPPFLWLLLLQKLNMYVDPHTLTPLAYPNRALSSTRPQTKPQTKAEAKAGAIG